MAKNYTQSSFNFSSTDSLMYEGEGISGNSNSHCDTSRVPQTPFQQFRKKHLQKIQDFNNDTNVREIRFVGDCVIEEASIRYSDAYGLKTTAWFPLHQLSFRRRSLNRLGFYINYINRRDLICDLFLTPQNIIEQQVLSTVLL